ncbi:MAG: DUF928 domain-containing protein, partial [Cyanobacteria bacterium P01_A01_bin.17]
AEQLPTATPEETVGLYAQSGLWFDMFSLLMDLHQENPEDEQIVTTLTRLLTAEGLELPTADILELPLSQPNEEGGLVPPTVELIN